MVDTIPLISPLRDRLFGFRRLVGRLRSFVEVPWALATHRTEWLLRHTFNRWARRGQGESMEREHSRMAETIWERMELCSTDRILDVGCGQGWACRLIAARAPECVVVGLDISDGMIRRARENSRDFPSITYHCCNVNKIPSPDGYFTKAISIQAFYYFERQEEVLQELFRVMQPGGELYLLICCYRADPPNWLDDDVRLPVHVRSISEYEDMLQRCGWVEADSRVFDFRTGLSQHAHDHRDRPLLITAKKRPEDAGGSGVRGAPVTASSDDRLQYCRHTLDVS
jgi:SAM-dependent methyltransferase